MKNKRIKEKRGITLIALIVTIIVLLILAGITISMLTGDNGIIRQAIESKKQTKISTVKEAIEMSRSGYKAGHEGKDATIEYLINEMIRQKHITEENVLEWGYETGVGIIVVEGEEIEIHGEVIRGEYYPNPNTVPTDPSIFEYKILETASSAKIASTDINNIKISDATKPTIRITGFKQEHWPKYYPWDYSYSGVESVIIDEFVIPYEIDGYTVTEIGSSFKISVAKKIILPNTIKAIYSLKNSHATEKIVLQDGVEIIGDEAFSCCYSLKNINIPNTVISIGKEAFWRCYALTNVTLSNNVRSIGESAFEDCKKLKSIIIPDSVTSLGDKAFYCCYDLENVIIGDNVKRIESSAFGVCSNIKNILIGKSVEYLEFDTKKLETIKVKEGNPVYDSRNNCNAVIETATNKLVLGCKNTIIPNEVTSIENSAFYSCKPLTNITIPGSVTNIGRSAFYNCTSLTNITIPESVTSIEDWAFSGTGRVLVNNEKYWIDGVEE